MEPADNPAAASGAASGAALQEAEIGAVQDAALVQRRREQICDAALELFLDKGYAATTIRDICGRSGVNQASIYDYVAGKTDILRRLLNQQWFRSDVPALPDLLAANDRPLRAALEEYLRETWDKKRKGSLLIYRSVPHMDAEDRAAMRAREEALTADAAAQLRARAGRDAEDTDPRFEIAANLLVFFSAFGPMRDWLHRETPEETVLAAAVEAAEAEDLAALAPGERAAALERAVESAQRRVALERDSLRDLPGWKEQLDPLAEAEEAAKAKVHPDLLGAPTTAAGRIAMEDNPDAGITSEDLAVHSAWLDALGDYKGMISRIDITYGNLGRVGLEPVESDKLGGFLLSVLIGVAGIVLSLPIGILLALGRRSGLFFIQTLCVVFIEFIRGVPLITLLFVANSVLAYFFPPGTGLDLVLRVVIMVTLFASAYMAEVIRGGLAALPPGQYEAADSLGLDYWKSIRLIIMPQALKISIPNIVSTFIGLFKDTTLVVVIGLLDPIGLISNIRGDSAWNGIVWEFYVFVGFFFFVCCFAMSRYSQYLERKLATDRR